MSTIVAPSILAANFDCLKNDIEQINQSNAKWIHVDVMDGVFVPNISFGFPILDVVKRNSNKFIDVHLMISSPEKYIKEFIERGANGVSIHYEGNNHIHSTLSFIRLNGAKAGLVLNPQTPVSIISPLLPIIDTLLIMSVNPGFGGQKFISDSILKIEEAKTLIKKAGTQTLIQVDGGININNCNSVKAAGAQVLVAGSAVFNSTSPLEYINTLSE